MRGKVCLLVLAVLLQAASGEAAVFAVNHADDVDDGQCDLAHCSLREAIHASEAAAGHDLIAFLIAPADGRVHTIALAAPLPPLADPAGVEISGLSQPGSKTGRSTRDSLDAVLKIELDGALAGEAADGLVAAGGSVDVQGLAIHGFAGAGIRLAGGAAHELRNLFVGTDAAGTTAKPNGGDGLVVTVPGCIVRDSIFSANGGAGIRLIESATGTELSRNLVGGGADGTTRLGNGGPGIVVTTSANQIATQAGTNGNLVRANGGAGIVLAGETAHSNAIRQNWIDENQSHGILVVEGAHDNALVAAVSPTGASNYFLSNGGNAIRIAASAGPDNLALPFFLTGNDGIPVDLEGGAEDQSGATFNDEGDVDEGPNDLLNVPNVLSARHCTVPPSSVPNSICVEVEYSGLPNQDVVPLFLTGRSCDELGAATSLLLLTTDGTGYARGSTIVTPARFPAGVDPHGGIAVMAVDFPLRRSSEVSNCSAVQPAASASPTALAATATPVAPSRTPTPMLPPPSATAIPPLPSPTRTATPPLATATHTATAIPSATVTAPAGATATATATAVPGDADCDGCIAAADLVAIVQQRADGELRCGADIVADGSLDEGDRRALLRQLFAPAVACGLR